MDEAITELITSYNELNSASIIELDQEPSPLEFMRFVAKNTPFVVRGGAKDWKAVRTWSVDYLKKTLANEQVNVAVTPFGYVLPLFRYESTNSHPPATPTPPPPSPPTPPPSSSPNPTKNSSPSPTSLTTSSTKNTTRTPAPLKFDTPRPVRPPSPPPSPLPNNPHRKQQPPPRIPPPRPVRPPLHPLRPHRPLPNQPHLLLAPPPPRRHKPLDRQLPLHHRAAPRRLRKHLRADPRAQDVCPPAAGVSAVRERDGVKGWDVPPFRGWGVGVGA